MCEFLKPSGIGKEIAKHLLSRGAKVILACRNVRKASEVASGFRTELPDANVTVRELDLCDLVSVRSFAKQILNEEKKLYMLINNAGLSGDTYKLTTDGFEEIYQTNYLGPFLLTELLLPLLKKSAPSRIINTGSLLYLIGSVNPSNFEAEVRSDFNISISRYCDSKLAMLMWTRALAEELKHAGRFIRVWRSSEVRSDRVFKRHAH